MKPKRLTPIARKLRRGRTDAETRLWSRLRGGQLTGFKFRFQMPIDPHVADFACVNARLVVERMVASMRTAPQIPRARPRSKPLATTSSASGIMKCSAIPMAS